MLLPRQRAVLLRVLFGEKSIPDSWNRSFNFYETAANATYFLLEQDRSGPCGTYAVIQAHMLRALLSGDMSISSTEEREGRRFSALAFALARILWTAKRHSSRKNDSVLLLIAPIIAREDHKLYEKEEREWVIYSLGGIDIDSQEDWILLEPRNELETITALQSYHRNIILGGIIPFTLSIILTKGVTTVEDEIAPLEPCLTDGETEMCLQNLVNLFLAGRAVAGVHNNRAQDDAILSKLGFIERCEIGFLTALDGIEDYCTNPITPFWVIHEGSHYYVLQRVYTGNQEPDDDPITCFLFLQYLAEPAYKSFQLVNEETYENLPPAEKAPEELEGLERILRRKWPDKKIARWRISHERGSV